MFSKKKCPNCGAKNSKERMVCIECGTPLSSVQVERQVTEVPSEVTHNLSPSIKELYPTLKKHGDPRTLCADLRAIEVDAQMAEQRRQEKQVSSHGGGEITMLLGLGGDKSLGLIQIQGSPICWVNILEEKGTNMGGPSSGPSPSHYKNLYLVPDSTIRREAYLETIQVKSVPIFGRVVDLRW